VNFIEKHIAWWMARYPSARAHREDVTQEAQFAAWLAVAEFDESRGAKLESFAWRRMHTAVRLYLCDAGVLRRHGPSGVVAIRTVETDDAHQLESHDQADRPLLLTQAWAELVDVYRRRGYRASRALRSAWLDVDRGERGDAHRKAALAYYHRNKKNPRVRVRGAA
jgi:hypothetical protein